MGDVVSQVEDTTAPTASYPVNILPTPTDTFEAEMADGTTVLAASVDQDGSRQIYDLDSKGVFHIRKIQNGTYRYYGPEVVSNYHKVKPGTPLSALAWRGDKLSIVRSYPDSLPLSYLAHAHVGPPPLLHQHRR